jgi:Uma2 family endonuclease
VTVVCGQLELDPDDPKRHTGTNPRLLVEVLSPSTEDYDRGEKLDHYRRIESLEMVLLVAHDARRVDVWRRTGSGWQNTMVADDGSIAVEPIDCQLSVAEIYRDPLA